jgi:hypothetical protein
MEMIFCPYRGFLAEYEEWRQHEGLFLPWWLLGQCAGYYLENPKVP